MNSSFYYRIWLVSFSLLCYALAATAQVEVQWDKTYGGSGDDGLMAIPAADGGYLLVGGSNSPASGDKSEDSKGGGDAWIVKIDANGNKQWDKTYGGNGDDGIGRGVTTPDGDFLLAGNSNSDASGDKSEDSRGGNDLWIIKIDAEGNKLWDKTFGGSGDDSYANITSTADGNYLLSGHSDSPVSGDKSEDSRGGTDLWVIKIDENGSKVWDKTLGGSDYDGSWNTADHTSTSDGGYLLQAFSSSNASGDKSEDSRGLTDYWIIKLDAEGNKQWDKTFGGSGYDDMNDIIPTADGGYLLSGHSSSDASGDRTTNNIGAYDYWIIKLDAEGNQQWDKAFGSAGDDIIGMLTLSSEEGYLLSGHSNGDVSGDKSEDSRGGSDYWIVKIDESGNKLWDKTIGGNDEEYYHSAILTTDAGFLLAGTSVSPASAEKSEDSRGSGDSWIIKIVETQEPSFSIQNFTLVNADTDQDITTLEDGVIIEPDALGDPALTVRANTTPNKIDSVLFELQGPSSEDINWNDYHLIGAAFPIDGCYAVTPNEGSKKGATWNKHPIDLNHSFDFTFTTNQDGEADGVVFVLQQAGLSFLGEDGSDLGYYNVIQPSLGIELDIFPFIYDNNTSDTHIALVKNGDPDPIAGPVDIFPALNNGEDRLFRVVWNSSSKKLEVYLDNNLVLSHTEDFVNTVFQGDPMVYFGFTGATGARFALQTFCNTNLIYDGPSTTTITQTERKLPYALFGDDPIPGSSARDYVGQQLQPGQYRLTATPYLHGQAGRAHTVAFQVVDELRVQSLTLVNAQTNQDIQELTDGTVISLSETGNIAFSVRATTSPEEINHIKLELSGPIVHAQSERLLPYALYGDDQQGDYYGQRWGVGHYTLTATPYSRTQKGQALSIAFEVVWSAANARQATAFQVYPIPTQGEVQVVHQQQTGQLHLLDHVGNVLLSSPLSQQQVLDLSSYGRGTYYLKLISPAAVETKRVVVE